MERREIIEKLTPIVRSNLQNECLELRDDLSAENVSTWTSLAFMHMLTDIENEFGIKFKMMELIRLRTMGDIIQSLEAHLANA
jgi:acyl carrier protein